MTYEKKRNEIYEKSLRDCKEFVDYVYDFYKDLDYGFKPTKGQIVSAVAQMGFENKLEGDSVDRERVREILQPEYSAIWGLKPWTK